MSELPTRALSRWARIDPTRPDRFAAWTARGRAEFLVRCGVVAIGLPIAIVVDLVLLVRRRELPLFFSAEHAIQLELLIAILGVPAGLLVGRVLWRVGERRAGEAALTREFAIGAVDESAGQPAAGVPSATSVPAAAPSGSAAGNDA